MSNFDAGGAGGDIQWLGDHCFEPPLRGAGMRGGVSLTAVRGLPVEDLLRRLGATDDTIRVSETHRAFDSSGVRSPWTPCMYGTSGDWGYVLEDSGVSSWYQHWTDQDLRAMPRKGEELVCLYANVAVQPSWLVYSPGDGSVVHTEFGEGFSSVIPGGVEGRPAQLERAMRDNGAVWPGSQAFASPAAWQQFVERHSPGLHGAVWRSIGDFLGVTLVRSDIEQGLLPVALLTDPFG